MSPQWLCHGRGQRGKTMDNKFFICENINIFHYLGARGGGNFNNQTGPILVHIYPLIYINLHVQYGSNLRRTFWVIIKNMKKINTNFIFFGVNLGPFVKSRGSGGTKCQKMQTSSQWRPYVQQGKKIENQFVYFWLFEGPCGAPQWSDWAYLASQLSSHPYLRTCEIKNMICFFFIFGGSWQALTSNPGLPNFQVRKTSSQSRQMYNKVKQ